jgi:hypothetical protein
VGTESVERVKEENIKAGLIQDTEKAEQILEVVKRQIKEGSSSLLVHKSLKKEVL